MVTQQKKITQQQKKLDRLIQLYYVPKNPQCLICGNPTAEMHHYIQKTMSARLRFDERNLIPLCKGCHMGIHHRGDPEIIKKIIDIKGEEWHDWIMKTRRKLIKRDRFYLEELKELEAKLSTTI